MLKIGTTAHEFVLPDENGDDVALSDLLQDGPLVLFFYPADFTPGGTKEVCMLRDIHDDITAVGLQVVGISPQGGKSHAKFREENNLPFKLLSDVDKVAVGMYDVNGPFGFMTHRVTYLVNQGRKIEGALQANLNINKHKAFIEKAVMLRETAGMKVRRD